MNYTDLEMVREVVLKCIDMQEKDWGKPLDAYCYALLTRIDCGIEALVEK